MKTLMDIHKSNEPFLGLHTQAASICNSAPHLKFKFKRLIDICAIDSKESVFRILPASSTFAVACHRFPPIFLSASSPKSASLASSPAPARDQVQLRQ
ncbi:hypothetical protein QN277_019130 [Acacia crassicarpa]|uniref:Uncharacterized protein n=1 Tax=Acacia crassicarpa TaxID=499986 RepID=A0AAE1JXZ9_9FABA|nr:hypothetical protein QN277_019130 [Acacia crassicarpa]